ncbi:ASCH domain-containing protein [Sunxiuqinia indica]|uniref:hypothetical protein n=1 Tax=Sunxiuqinia indica TaxID=2692584 RepID=UPI00135A8CC7|nr:hypothetical protein [Sunxiuqinia indica]
MKQFIKCPECNQPILAAFRKPSNEFASLFVYKCKTCGVSGFEPADEMTLIPALSIKQPWAWLIANGYKDLENRNTLKNFRGDVLIHAGKNWDKNWWNWSSKYTKDHLVAIPMPVHEKMQSGGIIGIATFTNSITKSDSPWFSGPNAFVIENAKPLPFTPCKGKLGFFTPEIIEP